ncbi:MAG: hypothetical protein E7206_18035 [Clostridium beijerinckii]|nr:hypothetical protein [Clostridium beijerinckii]
MNNMFLKGVIALTFAGISIFLSPAEVHAEWKQNSTGWWYTESNSYATGWRSIGGNWYYFYSNGYMASNTSIDGYYLNSSGAWVPNAFIDTSKGKTLFYINRGYEKNNKRYIEGYFDKFVTDLDEARDYERRTGDKVIAHDDTGDYIPDDGFDMPISDNTTLEVADNVNISEIDFNSKGQVLVVNKDFNSIITGKYKDRPIFEITLKNGVVTELHQEYRP